MIHRLKIAVLRELNNNSAQSGANILKSLANHKYIIYDVLISREGDWYLNGVIISPEKFFQTIDLVFNTSQNLEIQRLLTDFNVPFVGSDTVSLALSKNKIVTKEIFKSQGIKTPYYSLLRKKDYNLKKIVNLFRNTPIPCVVKSPKEEPKFQTFIVRNINDLINSVEEAFIYSDTVLIEEFIPGEAITCGIIEGFRNRENYTFLPMGENGNKILFKLNEKQKKEIQQFTVDMHKSFELNYYSTSDFIFSPKRGIYAISVNPLPELYSDSIFDKALGFVGSDLSEFLEHIINIKVNRLL